MLLALIHLSLLRTIWGDYYGNLFSRGCACKGIVWSREHVIPKSVIRNANVANDVRNIVLFPRRLNNARSSLKYVDAVDTDSTRILPGVCCCGGETCPFVGHRMDTGFVPPDVWKGTLGRSVLSMTERYPHLCETVDQKVMELQLARKWDKQHSAGEVEREWWKRLE